MSGKEFLSKVGLLIYTVIFKYCYLTGLFTMGAVSRAGKVFSHRLHVIQTHLEDGLLVLRIHAKRLYLERREHRRRRLARQSRIMASLRAGSIRVRKGEVKDGIRLYAAACKDIAALCWPGARTLLNLALPVLGIWILVTTMINLTETRYALRVLYGSSESGYADLGYIENELVYDNAVSEVLSLMSGVELEEPIDFSASFTLEAVSADEPMQDQYTLSNQIIANAGVEVEQAYGLYVDGVFIDAVREEKPLLDLLAVMQDQYASGDPNETVSFIKPVALREGLYPSGRVVNLSTINQYINRDVSGEFTYIVEEGDAPSLISDKFEIPLSQLVANNPDILDSLLIGQEIVIARAEPFLSVQQRRIETYTVDLPYSTENIEDATLLKGQTSVVREGEAGTARVKAEVTYINDIETERTEISREVLQEPVNAQVKVGTKMFMQNYGGGSVSSNFIWPAPGTYISNYFWGYSGYTYAHGALDFAGSYGTPIYASAPGTVTYAGFTPYGYGRHIIISHGGGVQTLYAHNSMNVVKVGDVVEQGQLIGYVGMTGNATGNHCHFEIRINGVKVDPLDYLP